MNASFLHDGDGNRVKSIINPLARARGVSTDFIGNYYEVTPGAAVRKYFFEGGIQSWMEAGLLEIIP